MRRLTGYVVTDFLKVFAVTLTAMTLFMLLIVVAREAMRQGLGFGPLVQLLPYGVPEALRFSVPATTLLAACTIYGRMAADNEVLAVKSAGVPPFVLVFPALVLTFLISLVGVWMNDLSVSWGEPGIRRVIVQSVEQIAYRMLRARGSYSLQRFSMQVSAVDGRVLAYPRVAMFDKQGALQLTIAAREAELRRNSDDALEITLTAGTINRPDGGLEYAFDGQEKFVVPLLNDSEFERWSTRPSNLPLNRIPGEIKRQRTRLKQRQQALAAVAGANMLVGRFGELDQSVWSQHESRLAGDRLRLEHLRTVPWRRWANGFSCFFFAMIGAPMSIRARNANLFTTFATCFLPILLLYYPLLAYGADRAKCGALPPYAVWLGNLACFGVSLWLIRGMQKH
jgi:lipopolysaccharide export system permease protein